MSVAIIQKEDVHSVDEIVKDIHQEALDKHALQVAKELESESFQRLNYRLRQDASNGFTQDRSMRLIASIPPAVATELIRRFGKGVLQDKKELKKALKFIKGGEGCLTVKAETF